MAEQCTCFHDTGLHERFARMEAQLAEKGQEIEVAARQVETAKSLIDLKNQRITELEAEIAKLREELDEYKEPQAEIAKKDPRG